MHEWMVAWPTYNELGIIQWKNSKVDNIAPERWMEYFLMFWVMLLQAWFFKTFGECNADKTWSSRYAVCLSDIYFSFSFLKFTCGSKAPTYLLTSKGNSSKTTQPITYHIFVQRRAFGMILKLGHLCADWATRPYHQHVVTPAVPAR